MGNLVRPESHPEPRGFPVQWADPGIKPERSEGVIRCVTVFACYSSSSSWAWGVIADTDPRTTLHSWQDSPLGRRVDEVAVAEQRLIGSGKG